MSEQPTKTLVDETGKKSWSRQAALGQFVMVAVALIVGFVFAGVGNKLAVEFAQWVILTLTGGGTASTMLARWTSAKAAQAKAAQAKTATPATEAPKS